MHLRELAALDSAAGGHRVPGGPAGGRAALPLGAAEAGGEERQAGREGREAASEPPGRQGLRLGSLRGAPEVESSQALRGMNLAQAQP